MAKLQKNRYFRFSALHTKLETIMFQCYYYYMKPFHSIHIACQSPELLYERITKAPFRVIYDLDELRAGDYAAEGAIVPELDKSQPLTEEELVAIATGYDTPDALRIVRVPQHEGSLIRALTRNGLLLGNEPGAGITADVDSITEAPPGRVSTTINQNIGKYVGMRVNATYPHQDRSQMVMGIACSEGARGLTFCPEITADVVSSEMQYAQTPEDLLQRRAQIRRAAARLQGEVACYTVWLDGSKPDGDTYEAYANFQPRNILHDGTSYHATQPATVRVLNTGMIAAASFESVV